jgi:hypothetical protein
VGWRVCAFLIWRVGRRLRVLRVLTLGMVLRAEEGPLCGFVWWVSEKCARTRETVVWLVVGDEVWKTRSFGGLS